MKIREIEFSDVPVVVELLRQLGYSKEPTFLVKQFERVAGRDDYKTIVCEIDNSVVAFLSMHFSVMLGYEGEILNIGYFVVGESVRSRGVGKLMEEYVTELAHERGCAYIELYSNVKRVDAHRFYERQGYKECKKFFMKNIKENF